ncbi:unnamed protein product [Phytomonas sp. EM1]|nr:unnamed protein product [Phytomonas sp. EM1]|eukprot:CCW61209.1 unnamed protein product [Phytomonas sp. isolate EM1]
MLPKVQSPLSYNRFINTSRSTWALHAIISSFNSKKSIGINFEDAIYKSFLETSRFIDQIVSLNPLTVTQIVSSSEISRFGSVLFRKA